MYPLAKKLLFAFDPERAHHLALGGLGFLHRLHVLQNHLIEAPVEVMGLHFPNPIGLAAGLDKNGERIDAFGRIGFGFIEVGTVTPRPQPGNPKPRLFRLPSHRAVINRMGFNNEGVNALVERARKRHFPGVLGINIGKNKTTPNDRAIEDYRTGLAAVYPVADYVTVNISSPNTPNLRDLQHPEELEFLLGQLLAQRDQLEQLHQRRVPLTVKLAPDLSTHALRQTARLCARLGVHGLIATNTTTDRSAVAGHPHASEAGGLSGAPLRERATNVVQVLVEELDGAMPVIGVGGIASVQDALEKKQAGAALVQVYTGLIYEGPSLVPRLVRGWIEDA